MKDQDEARIELEVGRHIATIWIAQPSHHNAMSFAMWTELTAIARRITEDPEIRIVALRGRGGRAFSTGADISEFLELRNDAAMHARYNNAIAGGMQAIADLEVPVVAAIEGLCVGGGVALALMCDLRLVNASSTMAIPAGKLGVAYLPDWVRRLTLIVGPAAANAILLTAGNFDAETMLRWGFANEIIPNDAFEDRLTRLLDGMAVLAPLSLKASKLAIRLSLAEQRPEAARAVLEACTRCDGSEDYQIGINAFLAKKRPAFVGR
jgi:enoyl-CoA hydratase/carnithine racemase